MTSEQLLKDFVTKIIAIQAPAQNIFGSGIPGVMGMSVSANQAAMTGGGDIVMHLKQSTVELVQLQASHAHSNDIAAKIKDVEGLLLVASTMSVLAENQTNALLDELHVIFET